MTKSIRKKQKRLKRQTGAGSPYMKCGEARRRVKETEAERLDRLTEYFRKHDSKEHGYNDSEYNFQRAYWYGPY